MVAFALICVHLRLMPFFTRMKGKSVRLSRAAAISGRAAIGKSASPSKKRPAHTLQRPRSQTKQQAAHDGEAERMRAHAACQCDPLSTKCERLLPRLHPQAKLSALRSACATSAARRRLIAVSGAFMAGTELIPSFSSSDRVVENSRGRT